MLAAFLTFAALAADGTARSQQALDLLADRRATRRAAFDAFSADFGPGAVAMALEVQPFVRDPFVADALWIELTLATGLTDRDAIWQWLWARPYEPSPDYLTFKGQLYRGIDPRFEGYFDPTDPAPRIRMDEVRWGGVRQDGIPPLRDARFDAAGEVPWLNDRDVVFGVVLGDDVVAFPKRILAWHEMLTTELDGKPIVGVYCTLCGSMIVYGATTADGVVHEMGTSGFLYRSNKLMFDRATQSLWTTLGGYPVAGPLADQDLGLPMYSVVTTTWKDWRARHPESRVLSLRTGHVRDYREGAAYRDYFATDALMFTVPAVDGRLDNKAEVLALRRGDDRLAIAARFLKRRPVHHDTLDGARVVVLTDKGGANRVYAAGDVTFRHFDGKTTATDTSGTAWTLAEDGLLSGARRLERLPSHRAFWFGWHAAFPETRLVK
ncbi:MAG: DUF3179 domain-containing protein [Myxococcota bacterium]